MMERKREREREEVWMEGRLGGGEREVEQWGRVKKEGQKKGEGKMEECRRKEKRQL